MKQFVRSVPAILFASVASLSLIALAGCGSSGSSNTGGNPSGPAAAQNIYVIQARYEQTVDVQDSVLVFSASATGSTTPTSTLMLPSGFSALSLAIGPQGQIYVGGTPDNDQADSGQILEYAAGSSGSATPTVTLNGSTTTGTTFTYPDSLAVNSAGTLFVSSDDNTLEAFASGLTDSSAPTQYLTWGQSNFFYLGGVSGNMGVDTAGDIFYEDVGRSVIDVFAAGATGATAPMHTITGTNTTSLDELGIITVDGAGDMYVTNYNPSEDPADPFVQTNPEAYAANKRVQPMGPRGASQLMAHPHVPDSTFEPTGIIEFAAGAAGNATPIKRISGSTTNIVEPFFMAMDAASNLYYIDANGGFYAGLYPSTPTPLLLEVFAASATGNVAPTASITSTSFTYLNIGSIAVN